MTVWKLYSMCSNLAQETIAIIVDQNFNTIWRGTFENMPEEYRYIDVDEFVLYDAHRSLITHEIKIFVLPE